MSDRVSAPRRKCVPTIMSSVNTLVTARQCRKYTSNAASTTCHSRLTVTMVCGCQHFVKFAHAICPGGTSLRIPAQPCARLSNLVMVHVKVAVQLEEPPTVRCKPRVVFDVAKLCVYLLPLLANARVPCSSQRRHHILPQRPSKQSEHIKS